MMDLSEAKRILAAFEAEGVEYVLVGSMAMAAQGLVRATRDLDFFVSPRADNVDRLKRDRLDAETIRREFGLDEED